MLSLCDQDTCLLHLYSFCHVGFVWHEEIREIRSSYSHRRRKDVVSEIEIDGLKTEKEYGELLQFPIEPG